MLILNLILPYMIYSLYDFIFFVSFHIFGIFSFFGFLDFGGRRVWRSHVNDGFDADWLHDRVLGATVLGEAKIACQSAWKGPRTVRPAPGQEST